MKYFSLSLVILLANTSFAKSSIEAISVSYPDNYYMAINYKGHPNAGASVEITCVDNKLLAELSVTETGAPTVSDSDSVPEAKGNALPDREVEESGVLEGSNNKAIVNKSHLVELHSLKEEIDKCKLAEDKIIIKGTVGEAVTFALNRRKINKAYMNLVNLQNKVAPTKTKAKSKPGRAAGST